MTFAWVHRRNWLQGALVLACLGGMVVIGKELTSRGTGMEAPIAADLRPKPLSSEPRPSFSMPALSAFSEVVARPVFSRTRRPGAAAGMVAASSSFTLVGIILAPADRHALLGFGQPRKLFRVSEGQEVGGWTVEAILPDKVIVRHADVREEVSAKDHSRTAAVGGLPAPAIIPRGGRKPPTHRRAHDE